MTSKLSDDLEANTGSESRTITSSGSGVDGAAVFRGRLGLLPDAFEGDKFRL